jgi:hypothetical protein
MKDKNSHVMKRLTEANDLFCCLQKAEEFEKPIVCV